MSNISPGPDDEGRRTFLKMMGVLGVGLVGAGALRGVIQNLLPSTSNVVSAFPTLILVSGSGSPIKTGDITVNAPTVVLFQYPLENEPNFLLRLGDANNNDKAIESVSVSVPATGKSFQSPGGVGPYRSIVASSAICQHLGCDPPEIRFHPPSDASFPGMVHCDCHGSTYDPSKGFAVVTGPTTQPLPNAILSYDSTNDTYKVVNMVGPTIYGHSNDLSGGNQLPSKTTTTVLVQGS
ncbi:MAG: Rieske 2Fe-2S domain-containing protein [Thermoplasmataceae archaeon]